MSREVVITGVGAVTAARRRRPHAPRALERRRRRHRGRRRARRPSSSRPSTSRSRRRAAPTASRSSRSSPATRRCAEAGWDRTSCRTTPTGSAAILGTGIGGIGTLERGKEILIEEGAEEGPAALRPADDGQRRGRPRCRMRHELRGPSYGDRLRLRRRARTRSAPPTRMIQSGDADAVVTGGSEAALTPLSTAAFARARRAVGQGHLAPVRRAPRRLRDGRGRRRSSCSRTARRRAARGAKILGTLRGYGASADAYHLTAPGQDRRRRRRARCRRALEDAGHHARRTSSTSTRTAPRRRSTTAPRPWRSRSALGEHARTRSRSPR